MKCCTKCKESKSLQDFGKYSRAKDGHKEVCKACRKVEAQQYYLQKDKQEHLLQTLRGRAKDLGVAFDLTLDDLTPPEKCPIFGVVLNRIEPYSKSSKRNSPSVDRIIPKLGYTKNNIQIVSNLANSMKQDATVDELILFARWVFKTYGDHI